MLGRVLTIAETCEGRRSGPGCRSGAGDTLEGMPRKKGQWCLIGVSEESEVLQSTDSRLRLCFKYGSTTWASHFISVSPGFFLYKIGIIIVPPWIAMNEVTCIRGLALGLPVARRWMF